MSSICSSYPWQDAEDKISLPEDLMLEILLRMSAQSIFAFRGVSKYYKELIDSSDFTRKHYEISMKTRPRILLHNSIYRGGEGRSESVVIQLDFESGLKVDEIRPPFEDEGKELRFLGCQRGILCYSIEDHLMFWNPITRAVRRSPCDDTSRRDPLSCVRYMFGYDHVTDDLKVLKITIYLNGFPRWFECVVYSSKTDSWKRTGGLDHKTDIWLCLKSSDPQVFVEGIDGMCGYILTQYISCKNWEVLAYDFRAEKFSLVPLPKRCSTTWNLNISSVEGCLCLLMPDLEGLIMKDYGDGEFWATLYTKPDSIPSSLRHCGESVALVIINESPHCLILPNWPALQRELYIYDVHKKQFNNAQIDDVHKKQLNRLGSNTPQHFLYVPSHRQT